MILPRVCVCEVKCRSAVQDKWIFTQSRSVSRDARLNRLVSAEWHRRTDSDQLKTDTMTTRPWRGVRPVCTLSTNDTQMPSFGAFYFYFYFFTVQKSVCVRVFVNALVKSRCYRKTSSVLSQNQGPVFVCAWGVYMCGKSESLCVYRWISFFN